MILPYMEKIFWKNSGLTLQMVLPLATGGAIYLLFRNKSLLMFSWIRCLGLDAWLEEIRRQAGPLKDRLPDWVIYSLPNALWIYSILAFLYLLWRPRPVVFRWLAVLVALATPLMEMMQMMHLISGTFSAVDIGMAMAAFLIFLLFKPDVYA